MGAPLDAAAVGVAAEGDHDHEAALGVGVEALDHVCVWRGSARAFGEGVVALGGARVWNHISKRRRNVFENVDSIFFF